jgi:hypothetical protein
MKSIAGNHQSYGSNRVSDMPKAKQSIKRRLQEISQKALGFLWPSVFYAKKLNRFYNAMFFLKMT